MTIRNQTENHLVITTTRTTFAFFKSVSSVFGVPPHSMRLGWLGHAPFVQAKELILCPYLQMRFTLTMLPTQLAWVSHSNPQIPKDRRKRYPALKKESIVLALSRSNPQIDQVPIYIRYSVLTPWVYEGWVILHIFKNQDSFPIPTSQRACPRYWRVLASRLSRYFMHLFLFVCNNFWI